MWLSDRRALLLGCAALALAGCGFRLQGTSVYPPSMAATYIAAEDRYSEFYRGLKASLQQGGVEVVNSVTAAETVIRIEEDRTGQEVLTVSARNVPTEYDVYYSIRYSVWRDGEEILAPRSLVKRQDYTYDATTVLGKNREEQMLLRYLGYTVGVFLTMVVVLAIADGMPGGLQFSRVLPGISAPTSELSPVELLQNAVLVFCAGAFAWIGVQDRLRRPMAVSLATLMLACLIRELDFFLDFYVVDNLWQVLCALLISGAAVYGVRHRERFAQGWRRSWPSAGIALLLGGYIVLIPVAQLVGHEALWLDILGDSYQRVVKVAAEEFVELAGYALIAIGTIEFLYAWSRLPRRKKARRTKA